MSLSFGGKRCHKINCSIFVLPINRRIFGILLQHRIDVAREYCCYRPFKVFAKTTHQIASCSSSGIDVCQNYKSINSQLIDTFCKRLDENRNVEWFIKLQSIRMMNVTNQKQQTLSYPISCSSFRFNSMTVLTLHIILHSPPIS